LVVLLLTLFLRHYGKFKPVFTPKQAHCDLMITVDTCVRKLWLGRGSGLATA